jgi:5-methyltetrahydrofolate--homocysteine methyltransferase
MPKNVGNNSLKKMANSSNKRIIPFPKTQKNINSKQSSQGKNSPLASKKGTSLMPIPGLTIIGESINDSVPSTKKLFDANDTAGLLELARSQDEAGAAYIDVNVGPRSSEFMADMVRKVQGVTSKPLSIDTPDPAITKAALEAYDLGKAGGKKPILNSISALRPGMFDLYKIQPFMPILLVSENVVDGKSQPCRTAEATHAAARQLVETFLRRCPGATHADCIIDPGIAPIGSDSEGNLHRLVAALRLIHADPQLAGCHASVGLSNFTVMLPPKRADGSPVKGPLESAFLTKTMPLGIDMIIGSMKRKYELLAADHPAMICLEECLKLDGFDVLMRIREFYA